tara:strand:- start:273 stop:557 length:285 start_codon:yes stop_codon:yes gene_type:complete
MSVKNDKTPEIVPIICGAVYRKEMPDNSTEFATMIAVLEKSGRTHGLLQRYGYSPERVTSGQANFKDWKLYAEPGLIKSPKPRLSREKRETALA